MKFPKPRYEKIRSDVLAGIIISTIFIYNLGFTLNNYRAQFLGGIPIDVYIIGFGVSLAVTAFQIAAFLIVIGVLIKLRRRWFE